MMSRFLFQLLILLFTSNLLWGFEVVPLRDPVMDQVGVLSQSSKNELNQLIKTFYKNDLGQLAVLIVPNLQGEAIESVAIQVYDSWKLGSEKKDDGVLILISIQDRRSRIEVGQGFEGDLTDLESKRIIDYLMTPSFKQGDFYTGLRAAILRIIKVIAKDKINDGDLNLKIQDSENQNNYSTNQSDNASQASSKISKLVQNFGIIGLVVIIFLGLWFFIYVVLNFLIFILNSFLFIAKPLGIQKKYIQYISFAISVLILFKILKLIIEIAAASSRGGHGGGGYSSGGGYSGGGGRSSGGGASGGW